MGKKDKKGKSPRIRFVGEPVREEDQSLSRYNFEEDQRTYVEAEKRKRDLENDNLEHWEKLLRTKSTMRP